MTDQIDPWSMTDMDVAQMCEQDAAIDVDDVAMPEEWSPQLPGAADEFGAGGLPTFGGGDQWQREPDSWTQQPTTTASADTHTPRTVPDAEPERSGPATDEPPTAGPVSARYAPELSAIETAVSEHESPEPAVAPRPTPKAPETTFGNGAMPRNAEPAARPAPPRTVHPSVDDDGGAEPAVGEATVRPPSRVAPTPRRAPAPVPVPAPDGGTRAIVDEPSLVKDPEKGLSGVRRRMGRKLGSKQLPPEQLTMNLKKPLPRPVIVAVVSHTGGGGKSTLTAAVGQQMATHRRDRVIAIDAAVAAGGLSQRLPVQNESTIQTLLSNLSAVRRWSDAREHTSQGRTGLELLASGNSIADDSILTAAGYRRVVDVLTAHDTYNLLLIDCDAGVTGDLMDEVLDSADVLVVPAAGLDGVSGAVVTMNRLMFLADKYPHRASHYRGLVSTAVVALNHIAPKSILRDDEVSEMLREKVGVREVVTIPFDPALKDGSEVDIMLVSKPTENSLLRLASDVVTSLRRAV